MSGLIYNQSCVATFRTLSTKQPLSRNWEAAVLFLRAEDRDPSGPCVANGVKPLRLAQSNLSAWSSRGMVTPQHGFAKDP